MTVGCKPTIKTAYYRATTYIDWLNKWPVARSISCRAARLLFTFPSDRPTPCRLITYWPARSMLTHFEEIRDAHRPSTDPRQSISNAFVLTTLVKLIRCLSDVVRPSIRSDLKLWEGARGVQQRIGRNIRQ